MTGITFGELGRIVGSDWGPPWDCDLCMATGFDADPCPYHAHKTWDEWITEAFKQWAWTWLHQGKRTSDN